LVNGFRLVVDVPAPFDSSGIEPVHDKCINRCIIENLLLESSYRTLSAELVEVGPLAFRDGEFDLESCNMSRNMSGGWASSCSSASFVTVSKIISLGGVSWGGGSSFAEHASLLGC